MRIYRRLLFKNALVSNCAAKLLSNDARSTHQQVKFKRMKYNLHRKKYMLSSEEYIILC